MGHNIFSSLENQYIHTPVLMEEIISFIKDIKELRGKTFVDCTLGEGGHSELILKTFKDIKIIGFERDQEILEISRKRLRDFGNRITFINDNFSNISEHLDIIKKKSHFSYMILAYPPFILK